MEVIRGKIIKHLLLHNSNWLNFFNKFSPLIRKDIVTNILKILACGTEFLGYHFYQCQNCPQMKIVCHTCKSRFCPSCGKKATDNWINRHLEILPHTTWQHVTFTFPQTLQSIFWLNRHLFNKLMPIPATIISDCAEKMGVTPAIFIAMHTFGRDLKRNLHFHLSTTLSGLSKDKSTWMPKFRFNRKHLALIKQKWTQTVVNLLRQEFNNGCLLLPEDMTAPDFLKLLDDFTYKPAWVVHFSKPSDNHHRTIRYLGRYLKRPPIGETRIIDYDGDNVTYSYFDHHSKTEHELTLPVFDFIKRLIAHVPDRYFRVVRYYNWLSNRTRNKYLPFVYRALKQIVKKISALSWRELIVKQFGKDPLLCPTCKNATLTSVGIVYNCNTAQLHEKHAQIAAPENHCYA